MEQHPLIQVSRHYIKEFHTSHYPQHYRLAQLKHRQAKPVQTVWQVIAVTKRQTTPRPTVSWTSPGGAHLVAKRHTSQYTSLIVYRLAHTPWAARR